MKVERPKWIKRQDLRDNRHKAFLFGDNVKGEGFGGQAKEMRGEFNAFGIPVKWIPSWNSNAFFNDGDFDLVKKAIDRVLKDLRQSSFQIIVIPADGIGTYRAKLDKVAPKIFKYLQEQLDLIETW